MSKHPLCNSACALALLVFCLAFGAGTVAAQSTTDGAIGGVVKDPQNNSQFGTLSIRRTFTNNTGAPVSALRFRIVEVTTFSPPDAGTADLRARDSQDISVMVGGNPVTVRGTTVEQPPTQTSGGGWNTSMRVGVISTGAPLANGDSVSVQFLLGVMQPGAFRFFINIEAAP